MHRKSEKEMQGAYELLKETLHFFIQNSYSIWNTKNELKKDLQKRTGFCLRLPRLYTAIT